MIRSLSGLALAAMLAAASGVQAFGTLPGFKGSTGEHERITRRALACEAGAPADRCFGAWSIRQLAGELVAGGTGWGAVGAPDRSTSVFRSPPHCDNGDGVDAPGYPTRNAEGDRPAEALEACRAEALEKLEEAVEEAGDILDRSGRIRASEVATGSDCVFVFGLPGRAKCNALEAFGVVLHASQDFYSHSNWTDPVLPAASVTARSPQGLGNTGPAAWMSLGSATAPLPARLISGCFGLPIEARACAYGEGRERVMHEWLNKDTGEIPVLRSRPIGAGLTARGRVGDVFRRAVEAAVADTEDKWRVLEARLVAEYGPERGARIACALRSDDPVATCT